MSYTPEETEHIIRAASQQPVTDQTPEELCAIVRDGWGHKFEHICGWLECIDVPTETKMQLGRLIVYAESIEDPEGRLYEQNLILSFLSRTILYSLHSAGGRSATISDAPTPITREASISTLASEWEPQARVSDFRTSLLLRDRGKCQFSKRFSLSLKAFKTDNPQLYARFGNHIPDVLNGKNSFASHGAHIVPMHLAKYPAGTKTEKKKLESWRAIHWMFPSLSSKIDVPTINQLSNGITLGIDIHYYFGLFTFGLRHVSGELFQVIDHGGETPDIIMMRFERDEQDSPIVRFEYCEDVAEKDKVSHELLRLHLAVGSILHATAAAEEFGWDYFEEDDTRVDMRYHQSCSDAFLHQVSHQLTMILNDQLDTPENEDVQP